MGNHLVISCRSASSCMLQYWQAQLKKMFSMYSACRVILKVYFYYFFLENLFIINMSTYFIKFKLEYN